ncbi:hypothetical protein CBW16_08555 [Flavobacteriaceae bacterium JJC]|nr:hypothetical protein CBW16_08555 [Flavobacteriaceae bacterium JJC]
MKLSLSLISFLFILGCKNTEETERYKIFNTVLQNKVSTYGIMANYLPYDRHYSENERKKIAEKIGDSLTKSKSLTYFLDHKLSILDTLNPADEFIAENPAVVEFKPNYSKNEIDFLKIKNLKIAIRSENPQEIDENKKHPTYLGSYDLSEPVFISKGKAIIRYQHHCGSKCGVGIMIYLKNENGKWKIVDEKLIWIS